MINAPGVRAWVQWIQLYERKLAISSTPIAVTIEILSSMICLCLNFTTIIILAKRLVCSLIIVDTTPRKRTGVRAWVQWIQLYEMKLVISSTPIAVTIEMISSTVCLCLNHSTVIILVKRLVCSLIIVDTTPRSFLVLTIWYIDPTLMSLLPFYQVYCDNFCPSMDYHCPSWYECDVDSIVVPHNKV